MNKLSPLLKQQRNPAGELHMPCKMVELLLEYVEMLETYYETSSEFNEKQLSDFKELCSLKGMEKFVKS